MGEIILGEISEVTPRASSALKIILEDISVGIISGEIMEEIVFAGIISEAEETLQEDSLRVKWPEEEVIGVVKCEVNGQDKDKDKDIGEGDTLPITLRKVTVRRHNINKG